MKNIPYECAVGSLLYAQTCTRSNISFIIIILGRYQSNTRMEHRKVTKKIMRYLQGTKDYMLTYRRSDQLEMIGYSYADFANYFDSRKFTLGFVFILASGIIS